MLEYQLSLEGLKGVILEAYGAGNAPTDSRFLRALEKTVEKGIPIVDITQCTSGGVEMGKYETSEQLHKLGVIDGKDITTESAVTKLMYLLTRNISYEQMQSAFEESLRGEITVK
jgi:L-asparaginase